jgi:hypothetical protein
MGLSLPQDNSVVQFEGLSTATMDNTELNLHSGVASFGASSRRLVLSSSMDLSRLEEF